MKERILWLVEWHDGDGDWWPMSGWYTSRRWAREGMVKAQKQYEGLHMRVCSYSRRKP